MERASLETSPQANSELEFEDDRFTVPETQKEMSGGEILIQALLDEGVDTIFGFPGGVVLSIYDELYKNQKLRHILIKHEQGGAHAADGYARATGKPGVVLVTSGPGATNTVTGIATAFMDSMGWTFC